MKRSFLQSGALLLILAGSALLSGCIFEQRPPIEVSPEARFASITESMSRPIGADVNEPWVMSGNGLEVRKWVVEDDPAYIALAAMEYGEPVDIPEALRDRLRRNGLRFVRVPLRSLDSFRMAMGGTILDEKSWYGQVNEWRELHRRSIGDQPRAVGIDGRVRGFVSGAFGLMFRSWTAQTETGPRLVLQVSPAFARDAGPLQRLLQRDRFEGELFASISFEHMMEHGYAYVLTCEGPSVRWSELAAAFKERFERVMSETGAGDSVSEGAGSSSTSGETGRGLVGVFSDVGPDAMTPMTIGEMLLRAEAEGGNRGVLILIPRLPEALFPHEIREAANIGAVDRGGR